MNETERNEKDSETVENENSSTKPKASATTEPSEESESKSNATAASNVAVPTPALAKVLASDGPIVKAVLLRHMRTDGRDAKPHAAVKNDPKEVGQHHRVVLTELIEEIDLDTTPRKNKVKEILGGPFTFLGQYEQEGTIVVVRKDLPADLDNLSVRELHSLCSDHGIDTSLMVEKSELTSALLDGQLPVNPHRLQPPFDGVVVRGDILVLKVAETKEELDEDQDKNQVEQLDVMSNEEFFLDYTKDQYVTFAARTDVTAPEPPEEEEGEEEESEEEIDSGDEEYQVGEDDDDEPDEEEKLSLLNLVLNESLRQFREENGRGPSTEELLHLRSTIAEKLGVEVMTLEALESSASGNKRPETDEQANDASLCPSKKVKFSSPDKEDEKKEAAGCDENPDGNAVQEGQVE